MTRLANGLLVPDGGSVTVDGMSTSDKNALFDIRKKIGVVFQNPDNQMVTTVVEDDVAFGPENLGLERARKTDGQRQHKSRALEYFGRRDSTLRANAR